MLIVPLKFLSQCWVYFKKKKKKSKLLGRAFNTPTIMARKCFIIIKKVSKTFLYIARGRALSEKFDEKLCTQVERKSLFVSFKQCQISSGANTAYEHTVFPVGEPR